jgi:hypothetical protein
VRPAHPRRPRLAHRRPERARTTTLQHAYQSLASEDEVRAAVEHLKQGVNLLAQAIYAMQVPDARLAEPLGIDPRAVDPNQTEQTTAVRQIAALVLLNAMLFHEELTRVDPRVRTLQACLETGSMHDALLQQWKVILDEIDYHAVFALARRLLENLPPDRLLDYALGQCAPIVRALIRQRVMLRHDLAGRIYHLLLGDIAKPLGTFYTSVPSATLLLRLALAPDRWQLDWGDPGAVGQPAHRRLGVRHGHAADGGGASDCGQLHAHGDAAATRAPPTTAQSAAGGGRVRTRCAAVGGTSDRVDARAAHPRSDGARDAPLHDAAGLRARRTGARPLASAASTC